MVYLNRTYRRPFRSTNSLIGHILTNSKKNIRWAKTLQMFDMTNNSYFSTENDICPLDKNDLCKLIFIKNCTGK